MDNCFAAWGTINIKSYSVRGLNALTWLIVYSLFLNYRYKVQVSDTTMLN
ncbi:MAG: hypothetical protein JWR18_3614 [Segetibacter sp.]|nr:hypothetical protein [Segetibacter sp.]